MSKRIRIALLAIAAVVAVPALAACDTSPGAAAIIGSDHLTTAHLYAEVNDSLADPDVKAALANPQYSTPLGKNRVGFTRATLSRLISQAVVEKVAAAHHITVTPVEITSQTNAYVRQSGSLSALQMSAADQLGVSSKDLPSLIRLTVLEQKLSTALTAGLPATKAQLRAEYQKDIDQYDQLDVSEIAVASKTLARRLLSRVRRRPSSFAALAARDSVDTTTKANGGHIGFVPRSQVVSLLHSAAKTTPGTFQLAQSSSQYVVLHIISRKVTPLADVTTAVKTALFAPQAQKLLSEAIAKEGTSLDIHVNPRFGSWNNTQQAVVAPKSTVSSTG